MVMMIIIIMKMERDEIIALLVVFQRTELMSTISTLHPKRDRGFQHVSALQKQAGPSYTSDHS